MNKNYGYYIIVDPMEPIGTFKYVAKVRMVTYKNGVKDKEIGDQFSETYGKTRNEAEAKMEEKVQSWLKSQE